jgi:hypothetical protein
MWDAAHEPDEEDLEREILAEIRAMGTDPDDVERVLAERRAAHAAEVEDLEEWFALE